MQPIGGAPSAYTNIYHMVLIIFQEVDYCVDYHIHFIFLKALCLAKYIYFGYELFHNM